MYGDEKIKENFSPVIFKYFSKDNFIKFRYLRIFNASYLIKNQQKKIITVFSKCNGEL